MNKITTLALVLSLGLAAPAFAGDYPSSTANNITGFVQDDLTGMAPAAPAKAEGKAAKKEAKHAATKHHAKKAKKKEEKTAK